jgi:hypothetical protein
MFPLSIALIPAEFVGMIQGGGVSGTGPRDDSCAIRKFAPQETQAPVFGGEAGESVPAVDSDDLKAIWQLGQELRSKHPGAKAIGVEVMKQACKPGANVGATWYRSSAIWMLSHIAQQQLAPWLRVGKVADPVFRTMASIPMQWMGSEVRQCPPFDVEEFLLRLNELSEKRPA